MKLNLDFTLYQAKTKLRDWWNAVKAHFTEVQYAINTLDDDVEAIYGALEQEIGDRKAADSNVTDTIKSEMNARFIIEKADRESADSTIISNVVDVVAAVDLLSDGVTNLSDDVDNIANGSTPITPTLEAGTTYNLDSETYGFVSLRAMANVLAQLKNAFVGDDTNEWTFKGDTLHFGDANGEIYIDDGYAVHLKAAEFSGYSSLAEIAAAVKTVSDALPTFATSQEIRDAWNSPAPTPTVTLEGVYDDVNSALIVTSTELAKLAAIDEGETFDIVIHATGVEYSGAAKYVSYIGANSDGAPPGYFLTNNGVPLWDSEYNYNTFHGCVMVSHYDRIDTGEIREGSW